ncbi:MAG: A/G-specific adenine glycosylase, partial [Synechococcus sp. BS30m-G30]|nr:A/G-specific adenine glycosylase [Synechococcus sp. BS30m-G30]
MHGRQDPELKPWMFTTFRSWPGPDQSLLPYGIWIAEVMLQQTQLQVVLPYWQRWMEAFPTLEALAQANEHDVLL